MKKDSKTKIARVYALALYEAAEERKAVPQVSDDMMKLLDAVRADAGIVTVSYTHLTLPTNREV